MLSIVASQAAPLRAQTCAGQTPAFPVPVSLWLDGVFRPGLSDLPEDQIPAERDSTDWDSFSIPGFSSGHELWESLDLADGYLYAAYNAGFSVWDISGPNPEDPERLRVRDGWFNDDCQRSPICGPFLSFPSVGGQDYFQTEDIAVIAQGGLHLIALSGRPDVGTTLWQFDTATETLTPIYQDVTRSSRQVRLVEVDGTIYAVAGESDDVLEGVRVYDVTRAIALAPCLEEGAGDCPGVYLGNAGSIARTRYVDVLQRSNGEILIASSDGDQTVRGLDLWKLDDPASPGAATLLFSGLHRNTWGIAMFAYEGNDYLSAVERQDAPPANVIKIFDITACSEPCSLGAPVFELPRPPRLAPQFLTYSTSGGTPFLYHGLSASISGQTTEQLLDLTTLGRPDQSITELTDGGPTYFDACESAELGYWAWYYPGNEFGLRNLTPQVGKFAPDGGHFYRAARGVLDVHVWEQPIFSDGFESGDTSAWSEGFESGDTSAWSNG